MRICFVYQTDYPWDVRVEKIAQALTRAGHQVMLVSANETGKPRYERLAEADVVRLPHFRGLLAWLNPLVNFPFFFNPIWISTIARYVRRHKAELIIVRDLPLALACTMVGKYRRIPVIMDMAECYPELLRNMWQYGRFNIVNLFARNPYFADVIEKLSIKRLSHIFVMVEESRERLIKKGASSDRLSIVSNTPPLKKFQQRSTEVRDSGAGPLRLVYAGWVNRGRGLDTVIDGMHRFVNEHGDRVQLTIIGTGDAEAECREKSSRLGLSGIVSFEGWLDNARVVEHVLRSDVGLVPHHISGHWNNTIPNKLFDYMASGLVVLTSNTRPVARIVSETGCGLVYQDYSPQNFSHQLQRLLDPATRRTMAESGRRAVAQRFNWEHDASTLLNVVATYGR